MKKPRFDYFSTTEEPSKAVKPLHSPLDNMPAIEIPQPNQQETVPKSNLEDSAVPQKPNNDSHVENQAFKEENTTRNITSNTASNITILPFLDTADIEDLREPATQVQSFRLTDKNKEWLQEITYRLNKEVKRGKITQADVLRIAFKLFEKVHSLNKPEIKKLLDQIL